VILPLFLAILLAVALATLSAWRGSRLGPPPTLDPVVTDPTARESARRDHLVTPGQALRPHPNLAGWISRRRSPQAPSAGIVCADPTRTTAGIRLLEPAAKPLPSQLPITEPADAPPDGRWKAVAQVAAVWTVMGAVAGGGLTLIHLGPQAAAGGALLGALAGAVMGGLLEAVYG
jgi:hypothetical protein